MREEKNGEKRRAQDSGDSAGSRFFSWEFGRFERRIRFVDRKFLVWEYLMCIAGYSLFLFFSGGWDLRDRCEFVKPSMWFFDVLADAALCFVILCAVCVYVYLIVF